MKKYTEYKDSGVEWIGEIPSGWRCTAIKHVSVIQNGSTPSSSEDSYWDGEVNWVTTDDLGKLKGKFIRKTRRTITKKGYESCGTRMASKGSVVISTRAPIGHIGILEIEACTNQGCKTIIPLAIDNVFCYYFFKHARPFLESLGEGSTFKELPTGALKSFPIPLPSLEEQTQIAQYLDRKTSQIDKLITDKEKLIELLNEERSAIINQAVTKGLNPDTPMKDSGIEWLGEVPEHWELSKLKYHTNKIIDGAHFTPTYIDDLDGVPFLRVTDIHNEQINLDDVKRIPVSEHLSLSKRCNPIKGDVLLSKNGTIGIMKVVDWDWEFSIFVSLCLLKFRSSLINKFFIYFFDSNIAQQQIFESSQKTSVSNLHLEKIKELLIPVPSLNEQEEIISHLTEEAARINRIVQKIEQEIQLLKEYKTALISEVVTGKVDVRDEVIAESTELVS